MRRFIEQLAGPLDRASATRPQDRRGQHGGDGGGQHAGLLLQRYLCENATGERGNPEEKRAILRAAIHAAANEDARDVYESAYERWLRELDRIRPVAAEVETVGRVIVGLGSENVLETGIRLHHTYGMPILPGSALKGLAAHYCDQVWGATPEFQVYKKFGTYHELLFGSTDDGGCIVFHDAWYIPGSSPQPLVLDVMTPHHPDYNRDPEKDRKFRPPTDFDSPTPVPFLAVTGKFRIALSWRGPAGEEAEKWTKLAMSLLYNDCSDEESPNGALADWGIGGKTTSGYGRLVKEFSLKESRHGAGPGNVTATAPPKDCSDLKGKVVRCRILPERTKAGGLMAQIISRPTAKGSIFAVAGASPTTDEVGAEVDLFVSTAQPQFRWLHDPLAKPPVKKEGGGKKPGRPSK